MPKGKRSKRHIPKVKVVENANTLQFSFKHLHLESEKFSLSDCCAQFWISLAQELSHYSQGSVDDFLDQNHAEHRHMIDFAETTEPSGFSHLDTEQLGYEDPWQFAIGPDRQWRVAGFMLNGTFYLVWLDPNHALYGGIQT